MSLDWITKHPLRMDAGGEVWPDLLKVCRYLQKNPPPGIYAREAPVQISTKFIEENKEILDLLLQKLFPALLSRRNRESFEDRYGFRSDEPSVRFKVLNKDLRISLGLIASDIAVPVSEARNFSWYSDKAVRLLAVVPCEAVWLSARG